MLVVFEELQDLRGVWSELSRIWSQIDEIREKPWLSVQPRKLRQQLDTLTSQLKELPARLRQYSSYEYVKRLLQGYTKVTLFLMLLEVYITYILLGNLIYHVFLHYKMKSNILGYCVNFLV